MTLPWDLYRPEPEPQPEPELPYVPAPAPVPPATAAPAPGPTTEHDMVVADAKSRSKRTLIQGLVFDLFAALVAVVATLSGADPFQKETWTAFGVLLAKSFVSAAISYFMRMRKAPTIRTQGQKLAIMPVAGPIVEEPDHDKRRTS